MEQSIGKRISMQDHEKSSTVVILPKRVRWKDILLVAWVLSFTFVGYYVLYLLFFGGINNLATLDEVKDVSEDVLKERREKQIIYLAIFAGFWIYFEYMTLRVALWQLFGKELIMIDKEALMVKRSIFTYGRAHRYFFENIKKLEYEKPDLTSINQFFNNAYWSLGSDVYKFEYSGKKKSFGRRIEDKEAKVLLKYINDRVKKWKKKA